MYHPYPGRPRILESWRPPVPPTIRNACRTMYLGAVASLVGIAVDLATFSLVKRMLERQMPRLAPAQLARVEHMDVVVLIAGGLIEAALWLWMTLSARAGKGWARVMSTVLFGIATLGELTGAYYAPGGPARIYGMVVWLIGLIAMFLLWQQPSTEFFRRRSGRR